MTFLDDDLMKREGMYHARRFHDTVWSNSICCLLSKHCLLRLVWFEVGIDTDLDHVEDRTPFLLPLKDRLLSSRHLFP